MRYKKFAIIPILFFIYVFFIVDMIVNFNPTEIYTTTWITSGGLQPVGVGDAIGITVTRGYLFGLVRLPVYTNYIGDISWMHNAFFVMIGGMTLLFAFLEWRGSRWDGPADISMTLPQGYTGGVGDCPEYDVARSPSKSMALEGPDKYAELRGRIAALSNSSRSIGTRKAAVSRELAKNIKEVKSMPEKKVGIGKGFDIMKLLKVLAIAFGIGLVHFFITAMGEAPDGNITWALILLVIYLEYKL